MSRARLLVLPVCVLTFGAARTVPAGAVSTSVAGTYKATVTDGSTVYHATWTITVTKGKIGGKSYWTCCPGKRTDRLTGRVTGSHVVIVRHCTGQGAPYCLQTYTGTVAAGGTIKGTWAGSGYVAPATFVLRRAH